MKKTILLSILTSIVVFITNAQIVNIPDAVFKAVLVGDPNINTNNDDEIQVSEAQSYTGGIFVPEYAGVNDLTGIEYFTDIHTLIVNRNNLTSVDLSNNLALDTVSIEYNQISNITLNPAIVGLMIGNNQLTNIDVSQNTSLLWLFVNDNLLTNLDITQNTVLNYLDCTRNQLTNLDVSHNANLNYLACPSNHLTNLDVSQNLALQTLYCMDNQLSNIDVSLNPSLTRFLCFGNQLTDLNLANGNNVSFLQIATHANVDLHCVKVDNAVWSNENWLNGGGFTFDTTQYFYDDNDTCSYVATTSISEVLDNNKFTVYPNPTNGTVYFSEMISLQIENTIGQIIANVKNVKSFDLFDQPKGIYFFTLTDKNGQVLQRSKIVKE